MKLSAVITPYHGKETDCPREVKYLIPWNPRNLTLCIVTYSG